MVLTVYFYLIYLKTIQPKIIIKTFIVIKRILDNNIIYYEFSQIRSLSALSICVLSGFLFLKSPLYLKSLL